MVFQHGIGGSQDLPISSRSRLAGGARRWRSRSSCWRWPGGSRASTPPPRAGRCPAAGSPAPSTAGGCAAAAWRSGCCSPATSPGPRWPVPTTSPTRPSAWSTCCSGWGSCPRRCCSARSTGRSTRCGPCTCWCRGVTGGSPARGVLTLPRVGRPVAGGARAAGLRLARAGLAGRRLPVGPPAVVRGVRRGPGRRGGALRRPVDRRGRPLRGLLHAGEPPLGRSAGAPTGRWSSAARWPTSTACRRSRGWSRRRRAARAARCSTASRTPSLGAVQPGRRRSARSC